MVLARSKDQLFQDIYEAHYQSIYGYVYRHILDRAESEDLTHEIFMAAYKALDHYDDTKSSIATWLYVITNNKLKNYYRDRKTFSNIDDYSEILPDEKSIGGGCVSGSLFERVSRDYCKGLRTVA